MSSARLTTVHLRRVLRHTAVLAYLLVTAIAFVFTMTRVRIPLVPYKVMHWSYGMMAPYQGDTSWNGDFIYEGQLANGTWEVISLDRYMPFGFGEKNVRKFLRVYQKYGAEEHHKKFTEHALMLLDRERARGKDYTAVRVWFDQWPRSNGGYEFLHTREFTTRRLITSVQMTNHQ